MNEGDKVEWVIIKEAVENAEAIARVRELHKPFQYSLKFGEFYGCHQCSTLDDLVAYPCPTIKALDGEQ